MKSLIWLVVFAILSVGCGWSDDFYSSSGSRWNNPISAWSASNVWRQDLADICDGKWNTPSSNSPSVQSAVPQTQPRNLHVPANIVVNYTKSLNLDPNGLADAFAVCYCLSTELSSGVNVPDQEVVKVRDRLRVVPNLEKTGVSAPVLNHLSEQMAVTSWILRNGNLNSDVRQAKLQELSQTASKLKSAMEQSLHNLGR